MFKLIATATSVLVSLGLAAFYPPPPPDGDDPPPPKAKHKDDHKAKTKEKEKEGGKKKDSPPGPAGDLRRAHDLLRRLRADSGPTGRPEERLRDWTERAVKFYRDGVKAFKDGDERVAHENGAIAHDLARAVDHARNAARFDQPDPDLPPPPDGHGPGDAGDRVRRDLRHAYDRITDQGDDLPAGSAFYAKAAKDLYRAARRDAEAGRNDRAGDLARAAEAMTHVTDHLGHLADGPDRPERRAERPEPRKKTERRGDDLPPPLPE